jgi:hypothetical protein
VGILLVPIRPFHPCNRVMGALLPECWSMASRLRPAFPVSGGPGRGRRDQNRKWLLGCHRDLSHLWGSWRKRIAQ